MIKNDMVILLAWSSKTYYIKEPFPFEYRYIGESTCSDKSLDEYYYIGAFLKVKNEKEAWEIVKQYFPDCEYHDYWERMQLYQNNQILSNIDKLATEMRLSENAMDLIKIFRFLIANTIKEDN